MNRAGESLPWAGDSQLIERLARLDEAEPVRLAEEELADPTLQALHESLDTLLRLAQQSPPASEFESEPACRRANEAVKSLGQRLANAEVPPVAATSLPDELGHYQLCEKLGEGGMGAVYRAMHSRLKRPVAVKVLAGQRTADPRAIERFVREMEAVGKLDHPHLVRATDAGEVDGRHYLVMELIDGVDLSELVRRVGPLRAADACELIRQAALGLQAAHEHGLVHRDVKPSNLMLAAASAGQPHVVKVLDLGLALLADQAAPLERELTLTGQVMGTIDYMAPEQIADSHEVDIRADIYSLGATLYKLLGGAALFADEQYNTPLKKLVAKASESPPSLAARRPDLPAGVIAVVEQMLAFDPQRRFATPAAAAAALKPLAAGADLTALFARAHEEHPRLAPDPRERAPGTVSYESATPLAVHARKSSESESQPGPVDSPTRRRLRWLCAGVLPLVALAAIVLLLPSPRGTMVVEIDDPTGEVRVALVGEQWEISGQRAEQSWSIRPGEHALRVRQGELEFETDKFAIRRGERVVVNVRLAQGEVRVTHNGELLASRPSADGVAATTPGEAQPAFTPDPAAERRLAEWVLASGGSVGVIARGRGFATLTAGDPLPEEAVEVISAGFPAGGLVQDDDLARFDRLRVFSTLVLGGANISDAGLKRLGALPELEKVYLSNTRVGDEGLAALAQRPRVSIVHAGFTQLGDEGLRSLAQAPLIQLWANNNPRITDAGLAHLHAVKSLRDLRISQTSVSRAGVERLRQALPECYIVSDFGRFGTEPDLEHGTK